MNTAALDIRSLDKRYGAVPAIDDLTLTAEEGEILSVLGASGCGKTTLLHLIAGHVVPDSGSICLAGHSVAGDGVWVPPDRRGVGMVFQDYALFPHLTVEANIGFGVRSRLARGRRVRRLVEMFDLGSLERRYPDELSGGQQQRVAIARALAMEPTLLLLDEPFSNLDASMREHVRSEIVSLLRSTGVTCVFVTHDQEEALAVSDRIAVMDHGRVVQVDAPEQLYSCPTSRWIAEFVGRVNIVNGVANGLSVDTELGTFALSESWTGRVEAMIRPELLEVEPEAQGDGLVVQREFRGHDVLYTLELRSGRRVWAHRPSVGAVAVGERVRVRALNGLAIVAGSLEVPAASGAIPDAQQSQRRAVSQPRTAALPTLQ